MVENTNALQEGLSNSISALSKKVENIETTINGVDSALKLGDNLRGKTIVFNTSVTPPNDTGVALGLFDVTLTEPTLGLIFVKDVLVGTADMNTGETTVFWSEGSWLMESYTFPDDQDYIIGMASDILENPLDDISMLKDYVTYQTTGESSEGLISRVENLEKETNNIKAILNSLSLAEEEGF